MPPPSPDARDANALPPHPARTHSLCSWIYDKGDFKKAPGSFRCPACNSPKSRFKAYKGKNPKGNTSAALKKRMAERAW